MVGSAGRRPAEMDQMGQVGAGDSETGALNQKLFLKGLVSHGSYVLHILIKL